MFHLQNLKKYFNYLYKKKLSTLNKGRLNENGVLEFLKTKLEMDAIKA